MVVCLDAQSRAELPIVFDREKKVGIRLLENGNYKPRFLNCYEPIPFNVADYGSVLEEGNTKTTGEVRVAPHNVGENYNLTFPTDRANNSRRSIRFEYRYQDLRKAGASKMQRARSEISGVFSYSPKNKWIIEYDLLIPDETCDDENTAEIITQIHEGSSTPTSPAFSLFMRGGFLNCTIRGDSRKLSDWVTGGKPEYLETRQLQYLQKNKWYHIKIYLKEGWRADDLPLTLVWVDNNLLFESIKPNCYKYDVEAGRHYDYLKFGVYKSGWLKDGFVDKKLHSRIYYFDNFIVKY